MTSIREDGRPLRERGHKTRPAPASVRHDRRGATPLPPWRRVLALTAIELRLVFRRRITAGSAVILPLVLIGLTYLGGRGDSPAGWGAMMGVHVLLVLLMTVYLTTAIVLTTRRHTLVFKRLRTSELSGPGLLLAVMSPMALLAVIQFGIVIAVNLATGAPPPADPLLVMGSALLGLVLALVAAGVTASLTTSPERVQFTTMPLFLGAALGSQIVTQAFPDLVQWVALIFPLVAVSDAVNKGWAGTAYGVPELPQGLSALPVDIALLIGWAVIALVVFARRWRWDPRS
jgi:ABC-2 type transport system permease protein